MSRHDQALFARAISAATAAPKGRNAGAGLDNNPSRQAILPAAKSSVPRTKQPSTKQSSHAKPAGKPKGKPEIKPAKGAGKSVGATQKPKNAAPNNAGDSPRRGAPKSVVKVIVPEKRHLSLCTSWLQGRDCRWHHGHRGGCAYAHSIDELEAGHEKAGLMMEGPIWEDKIKQAQKKHERDGDRMMQEKMEKVEKMAHGAHRNHPQKEVQVRRRTPTKYTVPLGKNAKSQLKNGNTVRPRGIVITAPVKTQVLPPPARQPTFSAKPTPIMADKQGSSGISLASSDGDHNSVSSEGSTPEPFPLMMCGRSSSPPVSPISQPLTSPRPHSVELTYSSNHGPPATPSRFSREVVSTQATSVGVACV